MLPTIGLSIGLLVVLCSTAHAEALLTDQASIEHNPFQRPPELRGPTTADGEAPTLMAKGALELRGVLLAGSESQANISGRIMALGQELDGYRLVSVSIEEVELRRDGERIILRLPSGHEQ